MIDNQHKLKEEIPENLIYQGDLNTTFGNSHIAFRPESASFEIRPTLEYTASVKNEGGLAQCARRMLIRHGFQLESIKEKVDLNLSIYNETNLIIDFKEKKHTLMNLEQLNLFLEDIVTSID